MRAGVLLSELKRQGVTHVVGLPDNSSAALFALLHDDPDVALVAVTREGEAFAIASGLWIGGKSPAVLIQNTGFLESGDSFRGTALRMRVPLLCLITYRGHAKMVRAAWKPDPANLDAIALSRADLDSAGIVTEPTLRAWGLPFEILHDDTDIGKVAAAFAQAQRQSQPIALLITQDLTQI